MLPIPRGARLSHFEILEKLGEGGMGIVYKARDLRLDRLVAIKLLSAGAVANAERLARFAQEAKSASCLNHLNIVTIYEIDTSGEVPFIAMEYVDGQTLDRLIPQGGMPPDDALRYALQIATALREAHTAGIIHRDLKPANIMVTEKGIVKVLDFGLAKLDEHSGAHPGLAVGTAVATASMPEFRTKEGTILGTAAYMSPEQVEGKPVDVRSDVFSFGIILYEMALGKRPFQGGTAVSTMGAILHTTPDTAGLPSRLRSIVDRALKKNPGARYASGNELMGDLARISVTAPQPRWLLPVAAAALLVVLGAAAFLYYRNSGARQARERIPEVERRFSEGKYLAAFDVLSQVEKIVPDDPRLPDLRVRIVRKGTIETNPPGAEVYFRDYTEADSPWRLLGRSPVTAALPYGRLRWKFVKPDFETTEEVNMPQPRLVVALLPKLPTPPEMVNVPGPGFNLVVGSIRIDPSVRLQNFQIDRYETTNRQYKRFVDADGYGKKEFWKNPFQKDSRTISWEVAMREFVDKTGRPGPSTWEAGGYPSGQEDFPVSGLSWYEAAAYAEFAGKSLPTLYHWYRAAKPEVASHIALWSNFSLTGLARAGQFKGEGPYGTFDMAGNVKEWCWNDDGQGHRFILGGSWKDPSYQFTQTDAQSPFDRSDTNGIRCVRYIHPVSEAALQPIPRQFRDYTKEKPASDDAYRAYLSHYAFDRKPQNAVIESEDNSPPDWKKQRILLSAAYGDEKLPVYLFLPKSASPPYQVVVYHPGSEATAQTDSRTQAGPIDFLLRTGRAFVYPIYFGTFERRSTAAFGPVAFREGTVRRFQDIVVTLDYLATRPDIDKKRMAYLGASAGSWFGPLVLAMEPRLKTAVFQAGGMRFVEPLPEADPMNFAPRARQPVLMINGRFDYTFPLETSQKPLFRLLGAPDKDKRHVILDCAHSVGGNRTEVMREELEWLDRYLGPVER